MGIIVDKTLKANPLRPEEEKRWFLYSKSQGTLTEKQVARKIAMRTALNQKEAEMALYLFREVLLESLLNGYTVKMSDWGTFYTTISSEGSDTKEEASISKVKRVKLHFRYNKAFEQELQVADFVSMESLMKKESNI